MGITGMVGFLGTICIANTSIGVILTASSVHLLLEAHYSESIFSLDLGTHMEIVILLVVLGDNRKAIFVVLTHTKLCIYSLLNLKHVFQLVAWACYSTGSICFGTIPCKNYCYKSSGRVPADSCRHMEYTERFLHRRATWGTSFLFFPFDDIELLMDWFWSLQINNTIPFRFWLIHPRLHHTLLDIWYCYFNFFNILFSYEKRYDQKELWIIVRETHKFRILYLMLCWSFNLIDYICTFPS